MLIFFSAVPRPDGTFPTAPGLKYIHLTHYLESTQYGPWKKIATDDDCALSLTKKKLFGSQLTDQAAPYSKATTNGICLFSDRYGVINRSSKR